MIKYHGDGNPESAIVKLELEEMQAQLNYDAELNRSQKWWDHRMLFNNKENLYRMWIASLVTIFLTVHWGFSHHILR